MANTEVEHSTDEPILSLFDVGSSFVVVAGRNQQVQARIQDFLKGGGGG